MPHQIRLLQLVLIWLVSPAGSAERSSERQQRLQSALPNVTSAGFLPIPSDGPSSGASLFYAFYESQGSDAASTQRPIVLWLQVRSTCCCNEVYIVYTATNSARAVLCDGDSEFENEGPGILRCIRSCNSESPLARSSGFLQNPCVFLGSMRSHAGVTPSVRVRRT